MGQGIGYCDLENCRAVCDGDLVFCEKPSELKSYRDAQRASKKERRKHPRFDLDLPLEHKVIGTAAALGGIAIDGSEEGLLIFSPKDMFPGTKLKIIVFFLNGYKLGSFEVFAEITRKKAHHTVNRKGFEYGIKFTQILEEDHRKLRKLLSSELAVEVASDHLPSELSLGA